MGTLLVALLLSTLTPALALEPGSACGVGVAGSCPDTHPCRPASFPASDVTRCRAGIGGTCTETSLPALSCESGYCVGGVCSRPVSRGTVCDPEVDLCELNPNIRCASGRLGGGLRCRIVPRQNGKLACTSDDQCVSEWCENGVCKGLRNKGALCAATTDKCVPGSDDGCAFGVAETTVLRCRTADGGPCARDQMCTSDFCSSNVCTARIATGAACPNREGKCVSPVATCSTVPEDSATPRCRLKDGEVCATNADCASGFCRALICAARIATGAVCGADADICADTNARCRVNSAGADRRCRVRVVEGTDKVCVATLA